MRLGIVADDITGAHDIGGMLSKWGYTVRVYMMREGAFPGFSEDARTALPDICVLDTNSRLDEAGCAYRKVFTATRLLLDSGCTHFHKKTCSVFRGNVGCEFDAMLDASGESFAVTVLGFPKNGRLTIGGIHYVHGKPLAESQFKEDPVHPMRESRLVRILEEQTERKVGLVGAPTVTEGAASVRRALSHLRESCSYVVLDVEDEKALETIAEAVHAYPVICGSSGIAEFLPRFWAPPVPAEIPLPSGSENVLCVAGSLTPQTRLQIADAKASGIRAFELGTACLFQKGAQSHLSDLVSALSAALERGEHALVHTSLDETAVAETRAAAAAIGIDTLAASRRVTEALAGVCARVVEQTAVRRIVVAGGESSAAVVEALHIDTLTVYDEIQPGLPISVSEKPAGFLLVLKSGSFGTADFFRVALRRLLPRE